ncbi:Rha family transcriptional regulator [Enterococcus faecalis]|uniref:Rha family transcriptional regulator n=1 Tax=Enterococcus faecalis TaxID=1351 RepID=UPI0019ED8969|nr:Rha family transcriptional regulator [Enterococcus faecalis]EGO5156510.1 phage regulatory protein [Enterococcus faecalis]EGO8152293.1 phage regulatory protein [Enterococcus faecalis]EGO8218625.1 phage regulatory protein [Enterococcus faecalis]EHQ8803360.1 ORF6C domain-containing protein [Enterococcus faecalis]EKE3392771.1 ORF6C domain-containing protein [Enterococcus faecalis]
MNNLVIMKDQQAVTSSLQVAETFGKEHRAVLKAIDDLKEGLAQKYADLFCEDTYIHPQNKQAYRVVYMNRDGFTLAVLGFNNSQKVLEFKLKYIEAFNQMEKEIQQPKLPTSQRELAMLALSANEETNERVDVIEKEVADLKDNQKIGADDYGYLSRRVHQRVAEVAKGFGKITKEQRGKLYKDINSGIKQITGVGTRSQLREKHYPMVIEYINDWEPSTATKTVVRQMSLDLNDIA